MTRFTRTCLRHLGGDLGVQLEWSAYVLKVIERYSQSGPSKSCRRRLASGRKTCCSWTSWRRQKFTRCDFLDGSRTLFIAKSLAGCKQHSLGLFSEVIEFGLGVSEFFFKPSAIGNVGK